MMSFHFEHNLDNTGLFKSTVGVLTTCHPQYTSDSSMQLHRWIKKFPFPPTRQRIFKPVFTAAMDWLTCCKQFGTNSIIVLMFVESQRVHI
jgi:hypothetical protein